MALASSLAFMAVAFGFLIELALRLLGYIIRSVFSYKLSKARGVSYPFISWIPVLYPYNYFEMIDGNSFTFPFGIITGDKKSISVLYIVGGVMVSLSWYVSVWLYVVLEIVYLFFGYAMWEGLYSSLNIKNPELFTIFSLFIPSVGIMAAYFSYQDNIAEAENLDRQWEDAYSDNPDYRVPGNLREDAFDDTEEAVDDGDAFDEFMDSTRADHSLLAELYEEDDEPSESKETEGFEENEELYYPEEPQLPETDHGEEPATEEPESDIDSQERPEESAYETAPVELDYPDYMSEPPEDDYDSYF